MATVRTLAILKHLRFKLYKLTLFVQVDLPATVRPRLSKIEFTFQPEPGVGDYKTINGETYLNPWFNYAPRKPVLVCLVFYSLPQLINTYYRLYITSGVFRGGGGATAPPLWSDRNFFLANFALFCRLHFATEPYKIRVQRHGRLYDSMLLYRRPCQTRGF